MKVKDGFMLREIAGQWVVVPLGEMVVEFNGIITLTETGALLWRKLETGAEEDDLVNALMDEYDVDEATARADVKSFLKDTIEKNMVIA